MDSRSTNSGLGLPQPGNDMGPLPPIHASQAFHAPDTAASHFDTAVPQIGTSAPAAQTVPVAAPVVVAPSVAPVTPITPMGEQPAASSPAGNVADDAQAVTQLAGPVDDDDTAFDEEWVGRAREMVGRTKGDPFVQSQELSKLKAQYIKLRYNKDVKVSE